MAKRPIAINYFAKDKEVWVRQPHIPDGELFLTIHPTDSGVTSLERQAVALARILNAEA